MRIFQINTTFGVGSTGRIAEEIGNLLLQKGHSCCIAFSRGKSEGEVELYKMGNKFDQLRHGLVSLLLDRHGLGSESVTKKLINKIRSWQPDLIHLHNIHGYYLNYKVLFEFLVKSDLPVVWTFHDSWPFTGHCTYFDNINCTKWIEGCYQCPKTSKYPRSLFVDRSKGNYADKMASFTSISNLTVVTPSEWLRGIVKQSFFKSKKVLAIHNGINTRIFKSEKQSLEAEIQQQINGRKIILGVANIWDARKGLNDFLKLSALISEDFVIVLIGVDDISNASFSPNIICVKRTNNVSELSAWYQNSFVFVNPTWQDNFPTTNIEALACGTPVITYNTGGSPEAVDSETGMVIEKGDVHGIWNSIREIEKKNQQLLREACRKRALELFDKDNRFNDYLYLYKELTATNN